MVFQRTLNRSIGLQGVGLHTGKTVSMTIRPAHVDHGIQFVRSDLPGAAPLPADVEHVIATNFATTLGNDDFCVSTVEHLMAALAGLGVDNATVELDAEEVPIMDGSAAPFARQISWVGLRKQATSRKYMKITAPIHVSDGDKRAALHPSRDFRVSYTIEYDHPVIRTQHFRITLLNGKFEREIARARTFGFLQEVNLLKANGFAAGGSLDNAVVVGATRVLNSDGLRYPDEFVRHKVLDAIGDLFLLGMPVLGHLEARKSGHGLNHRLAREVLANADRWKVVEFGEGAEQALETGLSLAHAATGTR